MAQEPDSTSALFNMREAERNFAKASVMYGRNAAFVENLQMSLFFSLTKWITTGKQFSKDRKASPVVLKWEPEYMDIAASRDFGISTGPWKFRSIVLALLPFSLVIFSLSGKNNRWNMESNT